MPRQLLILSVMLGVFCANSFAQKTDSTLKQLQAIPQKYITGIDKKITQYTGRITSKTEKTLTKLSRWENKIKALLEKASPETATRLFGAGQPTFTSLLQQLKNGETLAAQYQAPYNKYRDDVTTSLKYLQQQKDQLDSGLIKKIKTANFKMQEMATEEDEAEAVQQFIKERKKQLVQQVISQIGKSKYLIKINKEAYYYGETLKNYKEVFSDSKKAEETARTILDRIPAFKQFMQQNSQLATMFGIPSGGGANGASLAGLQTRASVQSLIQDRISTGGPNAIQQVQQNIQQAQNELSKLKDKIAAGTSSGNGGGDLPDFKPNLEKTKTFKQRLEFGSNFQFGKTNAYMPSTTDIGLSIGYKISSKSVAGIGGSFKMGLGSIDHIRFTNQGASLRSFVDWKLKKQFFISGGMEMNYLSKIIAPSQNFLPINGAAAWQQSALAGISKKISIKTKWFKETKIQLLYDFLSEQHRPVSQPVIFRVGYNF